VRIASFNVENMFSRPRALNPRTRAANRPVLEAFARLQGLLEQPSYSAADKRRSPRFSWNWVSDAATRASGCSCGAVAGSWSAVTATAR
jgi:hypothetical protein